MDGLTIAASLNEMRQTLRGAKIQSVYQPEGGVFVLHLFAGEPVRLLLSPKDAAIHLTALDLPYPRSPSPFVMLLRKYLRGGRIVGVHQDGWERIVRLEIEPREDVTSTHIGMIVELLGARGNLLLVKENRILGAFRRDVQSPPDSLYRPPTPQAKLNPRQLDRENLGEILKKHPLEQALVRHIDGIGRKTAQAILARARLLPHGSLEGRISEVLAFLLSKVEKPQAEYRQEDHWASFFPLTPSATPMPSLSTACDEAYREKREMQRRTKEENRLRLEFERAIAKRERTVERMRAWLKKADKVDHLRHCANLVMLHARELTPGMKSASLSDPQTDESIHVTLDPRLTPMKNAQATYDRAKRLDRGRPIVTRRLKRIENELDVLRAGLETVQRGEWSSTAASSLLSTSPLPQPSPSETAPRTYQLLGHTIRVGRNARQNDALLREARPNDLWLHTKGVSGAHVIIHRHGKESIPKAVIEGAARLAAKFSKARGERRVEVSYTPVKYVRKPKGAPKGLVNLTREDTLTIDLRRKGE